MNSSVWDRAAALGGVVSVVLFTVGGVLQGGLPAVDDSASDVASFFADNRDSFLAGIVLAGLAIVALVWFLASLVTAMRRAGEDRLSVTTAISFALFLALVSVAALGQAALAFDAEILDADAALRAYHETVVIDTVAWLLGGAMLVAIGAGSVRSGVLPRVWGIVTAIVGLLLLVAATALASDGFWSPTGGVQYIADTLFFIWVLVTSVLHFREVRRGT